MGLEYIIYPHAQEILNNSGLLNRIEEAYKSNKIGFLSHVDNSEVVSWIRQMKSEGFFESIPKDERIVFLNGLNNVHKETLKNNAYWKIKRLDGEHKDPVLVESFIIFAGCRASQLLGKDEVFNYKRFEFSNVAEIAGTVGAAIESVVRKGIYRSGLKWQTTRPDGRILINNITGDSNCDLRIYQEDITPYETLDPMGNRIHYRPKLDSDKGGIAAYHSVEATLFSAVLKWIEQIGINTETLENDGIETLKWVESLGQGGGTCAEHYGGFNTNPRHFLAGWDYPIPVLDDSNSTTKRTNFHLCTQRQGAYGAYIGRENDLVLAFDYLKGEEFNSKKDISVSFLPSEADNVVKGLFYQCAKGLGRTSARQLANILEYRFSPQFKINLYKERKNLK